MKKTVSVSLDEGILEWAKERSWEERKSMSRFIEEMISLSIKRPEVTADPPVYDNIEAKPKEPVQKYGMTLNPKVDIEFENMKLIEKRKKVAELKSSLAENDRYQSLQGVRPLSKASQLGKKDRLSKGFAMISPLDMSEGT